MYYEIDRDFFGLMIKRELIGYLYIKNYMFLEVVMTLDTTTSKKTIDYSRIQSKILVSIYVASFLFGKQVVVCQGSGNTV